MKRLLFYFDFLSPYSYLAWEKLKKFRTKYDWQLDSRPVPLGKIIHHYETKGPAEIAPKRDYLLKDCMRTAAMENITFKSPAHIPFNSLPLLRLATRYVSGERQLEVIDAIFTGIWQEQMPVETPEDLVEILTDFNATKLVEASSERQARKEVKDNVKQALEEEVFGLPSFIYNGELFWGQDSLVWLEKSELNSDPLDQEEYLLFSSRYNS